MRHNKSFNHLGRKTGHRKAMLSNMASSLILHKRIETTVAKAKALRKYVEPLITKAKDDSTHSRRTVFAYLKSKDAVTEMFRVVAPKVANRPGGYTRILRTRTRVGDAAEMALIELVDFNESALSSTTPKAENKPARRRSRRSSSKKTAETVAPANEAAPKAEATEAPAKEEAPKAPAKKAPAKKTAAKKAPAKKAAPKAEDKKAE